MRQQHARSRWFALPILGQDFGVPNATSHYHKPGTRSDPAHFDQERVKKKKKNFFLKYPPPPHPDPSQALPYTLTQRPGTGVEVEKEKSTPKKGRKSPGSSRCCISPVAWRSQQTAAPGGGGSSLEREEEVRSQRRRQNNEERRVNIFHIQGTNRSNGLVILTSSKIMHEEMELVGGVGGGGGGGGGGGEEKRTKLKISNAVHIFVKCYAPNTTTTK